jgi:hypothetical protein
MAGIALTDSRQNSFAWLAHLAEDDPPVRVMTRSDRGLMEVDEAALDRAAALGKKESNTRNHRASARVMVCHTGRSSKPWTCRRPTLQWCSSIRKTMC